MRSVRNFFPGKSQAIAFVRGPAGQPAVPAAGVERVTTLAKTSGYATFRPPDSPHSNPMKTLLLLSALLCGAGRTISAEPLSGPVGLQGPTGCLENPKSVSRLEITQPGVYENFRVDASGAGGNIVKITADDVVLRNCEIFNGSGNGVGVFGTRVVIENCRIHHLLAGSFDDPRDAHGVTGHWGEVVIRNCEIHHVSGDCVQFDPDRRSTGRVLIEDCRLWTGPLREDAAGFKAGQRPGENAVDTKVPPGEGRCELILRNCHLHGWNQPAAMENMAALNLKENVDALVSGCVLEDNEIAFRVRGPGRNGGARVTIGNCAVNRTGTGVRAEDGIEKLAIAGIAFGEGVKERIRFVNGRPGPGYTITGEGEAPPADEVLKTGFPGPPDPP